MVTVLLIVAVAWASCCAVYAHRAADRAESAAAAVDRDRHYLNRTAVYQTGRTLR